MIITVSGSSIGTWLASTLRDPCKYTRFKVFDVVHGFPPDEKTLELLAAAVRNDRFDPSFIARLADSLGWRRVEELVRVTAVPTLTSVKRGDFGETVTSLLLEQIHDYIIPVRKLRFKFIGNQTQPSTDILALKLDESNRIIEVCFVESKVRSIHSPRIGIEGVTQLRNDYSSELPSILVFVAARLYDTGNYLLDPFLSYMGERKDPSELDSFSLGLCIDEQVWDDQVLQNLEDEGIPASPLIVHAVRIAELRALTDSVFGRLGISHIDDDD